MLSEKSFSFFGWNKTALSKTSDTFITYDTIFETTCLRYRPLMTSWSWGGGQGFCDDNTKAFDIKSVSMRGGG